MSDAHRAMFQVFAQPDPHANGVMRLLEGLYPAFAKKIFQGNEVMRRIVMSGYSPLDVLEYPICGRCETPAAWDGFGTKDGVPVMACSCLAERCGARTLAPITFREWMTMELKRKAPPDIADVAEGVVDAVAARMMGMAVRAYERELGKHQGIVMPDGSTHAVAQSDTPEPRPRITLEERPIEDEEIQEIVRKELEALERDV